MQLHVGTHTVPTVSCPPSPPFLSSLEPTCASPRKNYLRHFTEKRIFPFPLPSSARQELRFFFKNGWQMPRCTGLIVGAFSVSPRLAVSGCTARFRPVRLIRHSSEEATGHRVFISGSLTEAEPRDGRRRWCRGAVLISPRLPIPLRPSPRCILSMLLAWTTF